LLLLLPPRSLLLLLLLLLLAALVVSLRVFLLPSAGEGSGQSSGNAHPTDRDAGPWPQPQVCHVISDDISPPSKYLSQIIFLSDDIAR
jgi:hypothetical protein